MRLAKVQSSCLGQLLEVKRARACHSLGNGWHRELLADSTPPHPELGQANTASHEGLLREEARRSGIISSQEQEGPCMEAHPTLAAFRTRIRGAGSYESPPEVV